MIVGGNSLRPAVTEMVRVSDRYSGSGNQPASEQCALLAADALKEAIRYYLTEEDEL